MQKNRTEKKGFKKINYIISNGLGLPPLVVPGYIRLVGNRIKPYNRDGMPVSMSIPKNVLFRPQVKAEDGVVVSIA